MKKSIFNKLAAEAEKKLQNKKITLSGYNDILYCLCDIIKNGNAETITQTTANFFKDNKAIIKNSGIGYKINY